MTCPECAHWKALWRQDLANAADAIRERDAALARLAAIDALQLTEEWGSGYTADGANHAIPAYSKHQAQRETDHVNESYKELDRVLMVRRVGPWIKESDQ